MFAAWREKTRDIYISLDGESSSFRAIVSVLFDEDSYITLSKETNHPLSPSDLLLIVNQEISFHYV